MSIRAALIVGFGRAGRGLHLTALEAIGFDGRIGVLDVRPDAAAGTGRVEAFRDLEEVPFDKKETAVHLCDPPSSRARTLSRVLEAGYRNVILEKPLSASAEDAERINAEVAACGARALVVSNWLFSTLTNFIAAHTERRRPRRLLIEHDKQRIHRTITNSTHCSGFEVEMPHMLALALHFAGRVELASARAADLRVGGLVFPGMARTELSLVSPDTTVTLRSNLCAPVSKRFVTAEWDDGTRIEGYHPISGTSDRSSQVRIVGRDGSERHAIFADDSLSTMMASFYRALGRESTEGIASGLPFHTEVVRLLCRAKLQAAREDATASADWNVGSLALSERSADSERALGTSP